ncbi:MAG TPA: cation diffusion facilitator family transporter [Actinomycetota bacterium]|nr:cation diffusion facilitator family transporter [Actinomycetota bacterium]
MDSIDRRRLGQQRVLWFVLALNAVYMLVEITAGIAFNSLALLADAAHMLFDVVSLGVALYAHSLMRRPASARHTYGYQRSEVLGALVNSITLLAIVGWISYEAFRRLLSGSQSVDAWGLLIVAASGLAVNVGSAWILNRAQEGSLNMRAAFLHMVSDAAGSGAAVVAATGLLGFGAMWLDPVASLCIALLIVFATWGVLRDTVHVLMEGTPRGLDVEEVEAALAAEQGVSSVHHLHLWNLASDIPALSAHVVLSDDVRLRDAQMRGEELRAMLQRRFGIRHSTLELECDPCAEVNQPVH